MWMKGGGGGGEEINPSKMKCVFTSIITSHVWNVTSLIKTCYCSSINIYNPIAKCLVLGMLQLHSKTNWCMVFINEDSTKKERMNKWTLSQTPLPERMISMDFACFNFYFLLLLFEQRWGNDHGNVQTLCPPSMLSCGQVLVERRKSLSKRCLWHNKSRWEEKVDETCG
jgi:hypothetical protein